MIQPAARLVPFDAPWVAATKLQFVLMKVTILTMGAMPAVGSVAGQRLIGGPSAVHVVRSFTAYTTAALPADAAITGYDVASPA